MNQDIAQTPWSENVIVADADYVDRVAFNLIVNFERMLGRPIPPADMARWIDCVALDGGVREGNGDTQVVLIHEKASAALDNFAPADYGRELDGKAFRDHLGEFVVSALPVEAVTTKDDLLLDVVEMAVGQPAVKRVMVVPDSEGGDCYDRLRQRLRSVGDDKRVTLFAMQPMPGGNFRQEILGYSLMQALGIRGEEL